VNKKFYNIDTFAAIMLLSIETYFGENENKMKYSQEEEKNTLRLYLVLPVFDEVSC
jgi:hypothetical protein